MNSIDILNALNRHWPDGDYVKIEEAPDSCDRMGGKIDLLAISCWRSRGLSIDAVEVKVSYSDWARERECPAKAEFWWRHCDRFWLAVPDDLVKKVQPELPDGWGLFAIRGSAKDMLDAELAAPKVRVIVRPQRHQRDQLRWQTIVGLLRASSSSGIGALQRAENRGRDRGYEEAKRRFMPKVAA